MPPKEAPIDFGYIIEGVVERNPLTGRCVIRTADPQGAPVVVDVDLALTRYLGAEVRMILTSFETINRLQEMADSGEIGTVVDPAGGT